MRGAISCGDMKFATLEFHVGIQHRLLISMAMHKPEECIEAVEYSSILVHADR